MNSNPKFRSTHAKLNGVKSRRVRSVSKKRFVIPENLSEVQLKQLIRSSTVSAIRQNRKSGVTTLSAKNGNFVRINPDGSKVIVKKAPASLSIAKGKYRLAK